MCQKYFLNTDKSSVHYRMHSGWFQSAADNWWCWQNYWSSIFFLMFVVTYMTYLKLGKLYYNPNFFLKHLWFKLTYHPCNKKHKLKIIYNSKTRGSIYDHFKLTAGELREEDLQDKDVTLILWFEMNYEVKWMIYVWKC